MKAHIHPVQPTAVLYGIARDEAGLAARAALCERGIRVEELQPADLSQPVGLAAGLGGRRRAPYDGPAPEPGLILLGGLSGPALNDALDAVRDAGVRDVLRAVVTKTNRNWTVLELMEELAREKAAMERGRQA